MSTTFKTETGLISTKFNRLTQNVTLDILTADGNPVMVEFVKFVNTGAGTPNVTLDVYSGTVAFSLLTTHTLAAASTESTEENKDKATYRIDGPIMVPIGYKLRALTNGTTNEVHVTTTVVSKNRSGAP